MRATVAVAATLGAFATLAAAAPVPTFDSQMDFAARDLSAGEETELEPRLIGKLVKGVGHLIHRHHRRDLGEDAEEAEYFDARDLSAEDAELEPRLIGKLVKGVGHLIHRHHRRDLGEDAEELEYVEARGFDDAEAELEPRLIGKLVKGVGHLIHRHHRRDLLDVAEDEFELNARDVEHLDDEQLERRLAIGLALKAARKAGGAAVHAIANRHHNRNKRDLGDDEEQFDARDLMQADDEELERRLAVGLALKAARKAGGAAVHAIANRHRNRNKRDLGDDEELERRLAVGLALKAARKAGGAAVHAIANRHRNRNKRDLGDDEELEFEQRSFDDLLDGRDDYAMFE